MSRKHKGNTGDIGDQAYRVATRKNSMAAYDALDPSTRALLHGCPLPMSPADALENWHSMRRQGYSIKAFNKVLISAIEEVTGVKKRNWI